MVAKELDWYKGWDAAVTKGDHPHVYKWFSGGRLNLSYLALDRHANSSRKNKVAVDMGGRAPRRSRQPQGGPQADLRRVAEGGEPNGVPPL